MRDRSTPGIRARLLMVVIAIFLVAGCATAPDPSDPEAVAEFMAVNDPLEPTNRAVFEVNRGLDRSLLKPVATAYREVMPEFLRDGLSNILANLRTPIILFNDLLQGEVDRAMVTFVRFMINSTIGMGGFTDMAGEMGLEGHEEDFGQTLAVWGVGEGPFIMLPVFGPSNPRDTVGMVADFLMDPLNLWAGNTDRQWVSLSRGASEAVDRREGNLDLIDDVEKSSLDFYASIRSLYRQRRADEITNGKGSANVPAPSMGENPDAPTLDGPEELSWR